MYEDGKGVKKDGKKAFEYYERAAKQGIAPYQCELGFKYLNGTGVEQDSDKAMKYFKLATDQGFDYAMLIQGELHMEGIGVPVDLDKSVKYLKQAARQGNEKAKEMLEYFGLYIDEEGKIKSLTDAKDKLAQAVDTIDISTITDPNMLDSLGVELSCLRSWIHLR